MFLWMLLIPPSLVVLIQGILLGVILKAFWPRKPELILLAVLWLAQATILIAWTMGITTSDAFLAGGWENLLKVRPSEPGVLDSYLENTLMGVFWILAYTVPILVVILSIIRIIRRQPQAMRGTAFRVIALLLVVAVLYAMAGDTHEFHRMEPVLLESVSPDSQLRVRLVPINALCDVNGVVLVRYPGSKWWMPMGNIGDQLTTTTLSELKFEWGEDRVTLWVGQEAHVFDTTTATPLKPRKAPPTTMPQTIPAVSSK